nr:hypothetical protein [Eubacterium sp.]
MKKDNVFWGIILVLAAVYIIINSLGFLPDVNVVRLAIGIICVMVFCKSLYRLQFGGMLFSAAIFAITFDQQLGIEAITPWPVLCAALLGSIGLDMIFGKQIIWRNDNAKKKSSSNSVEGGYVSGEEVVLNAGIFNGYKKTVSSDDFKKASVFAKFSGVEISFDDAVIQGGTAVIDLDVAFSGVELYIPKSWTVVNETDCMFGGFEEHRSQYNGEEGPTVTIRGNVRFSGVEVYRL